MKNSYLFLFFYRHPLQLKPLWNCYANFFGQNCMFAETHVRFSFSSSTTPFLPRITRPSTLETRRYIEKFANINLANVRKPANRRKMVIKNQFATFSAFFVQFVPHLWVITFIPNAFLPLCSLLDVPWWEKVREKKKT